MNPLQIYRKRLIPSECILLKDDVVVEVSEDVVITKWDTINPKASFSHGSSCYFLKEGYKVSKFYRSDNSLLYWYCDIMEYEFDCDQNILTTTDLLADVVVYPDGRVKVMDLDELAEALDKNLITPAQMCLCLRNLNNLLTIIDRDKFDRLQAKLNELGL